MLRGESILDAPIRGTTGGRIEIDDSAPRVTRLLDVTSDWNDVSVAIADLAIAEGWAIEDINCVGTGNDVIARKKVGATWLLLESGAGTAGAGVIISVAADQRPPVALRSSGRCPSELSEAAGRK